MADGHFTKRALAVLLRFLLFRRFPLPKKVAEPGGNWFGPSAF